MSKTGSVSQTETEVDAQAEGGDKDKKNTDGNRSTGDKIISGGKAVGKFFGIGN